MPRKAAHTSYMTVLQYGSRPQICSKHRTFHAAVRAAKKCERQGGMHHDIWEVRVYPQKITK
jgi:hypothetical protein